MGKAPAPAPGPSPAPVTGTPSGQGSGKPAPPPNGGLVQPATPSDPNATGLFDIPGEVKDAIASFLASLLQPFVVPVMNLLAHLLLSTPDVTQIPRVAGLWEGLRVLACSLYGLAVLAAGILAMSHGTVQQRWAARDLIPRLVLGMLAANLSLTVCHQVIGLVNTVSAAVFGDVITADDLAGTLTGMLLNGNPTTGPLYLVVFALAVTVIAVAVVATVLIRIACVLVLVVAAPLLLACHGSPATEGAARLWWKAFFGIMGIQVLQSVVFLVTVKVLLDRGNYSFLGAPTAGALINLTVLGGCLYLLVKIPGWIRHLVTNPVQRTVGGRGGLHLLQKVALGALGLPLGPYALGAQISGRFRTPGAPGRSGMPGRGPRRPPGTPSRANPRGPTPPGTPGRAGRPRPPSPGGAPGRGGPGTPPGGPRPGHGAGPHPSGPAGGPMPPGSGPGVPSYQWGTPRRNVPPQPGSTGRASPSRRPAAPPAPLRPALPTGAGGQQPTPQPTPTPPPGPGGGGPRPATPHPPTTPRPRPALPPPVPRPALPAPPLPGGPQPSPRQRRKP
ncbi:hypothetical protein [Streptacidiphilus rugosus]|uniref:hypothetical protein n=1 Tax=Streptacidiphilus rugosus TaxID=405783 RepID=UPI0012F824E3|nr:hypothetical protein [Streptacidiphilus rugosus]